MEDRKCNTAIDSHWTKQCCCFSSGSAVGFDSSTFQHGLGWFPIGFTDANCFLRRLKVTATLCPQRRGEPPPILPGSTHKINTPNLKAKKKLFSTISNRNHQLIFFFFWRNGDYHNYLLLLHGACCFLTEYNCPIINLRYKKKDALCQFELNFCSQLRSLIISSS